MDTFFIYLLKSAVCFAVFYIFIVAFLSKETFFKFNRYVLLVGMIICMVLPFLNINTSSESVIQKPFVKFEKTIIFEPSDEIIDAKIGKPEATIAENVSYNQVVTPLPIKPLYLIFAVYLFGIVVNAFLLGRSFYRMSRLIENSEKILYDNYTLAISNEDINPFSWRKYIVISNADFEKHSEEIIAHEKAHIYLRHTADILFVEAILLFQWFNPAVWLLKRELQNIHEYQADKSVLASGIDATKYQLLLVKKAVGVSSYTLANSFNHSKIKKRITMMLKEKSSRWAKLRLAILLPAIVFTVYAFSRPEMNVENLESKVNENLGIKINLQKNDAEKIPIEKLVGMWFNVSSKVNGQEENDNSIHTKTLTKDGKFSWDKKVDGKIVSGASGTYTFDGENYIENIEKDLGGMSYFVGKKAIYKITFNGDDMVVKGTLGDNIEVEEVWRRHVRFTPPTIVRDSEKKEEFVMSNIPIAENTNNELVGVWELVSSRENGREWISVNQRKYLTKNRFSWEQFNAANIVVTGASGTYTFDGEKYTETITSGLDDMANYIGAKAEYEVKMDGDMMIITGNLNGSHHLEQVWKRIE